MRISRISVKNYRSLADVTLEVGDYAAFIGANGSGKSSVLYALDWYFNGTALAGSDVHGYVEGKPLPQDSSIEVSVTFVDLTLKDRERLQQYGRGDRVEIRRTWYAESGKTKTVGNAKQGPQFSDVRRDQTIAERRAKYREVAEAVDGLAALAGSASKDAILEALAEWEAEPGNTNLLVDVSDDDATQMMGWNGANVLRECVRYILVPAATSISGEVGTAGKGTALTELIGSFMAAASAKAQAAWLEKHADAIAELATEISTSIGGATGLQETRINARLAALVPNASVKLTPTVPEFTPRVDPSIATAVTVGGVTNDVARQGHGVQRAVMISMFQAMVPDADFETGTHQAEVGEDEAAADARLKEALDCLPATIVAIEEPEIYQHPVRARSFARTLVELSSGPAIQVVLATHSPYFVQPEMFGALHRFTYEDGKTAVENATAQAVADAADLDVESVEKAIARYVPTEFSEGFFAEGVALVEGGTDRAVLEALASRLARDLDLRGISILSVEGKGGLRVARAILVQLGIPTYVLADGDFGTAARKTNKTEEQIAQAHASHKKATEDLIAALPCSGTPIHGALPYEFGEPTVVSDFFACWRDDIEQELAAWVSFEQELAAAGVALAARNNKNLLAYRNAVEGADLDDLPPVIGAVVDAIIALVGE